MPVLVRNLESAPAKAAYYQYRENAFFILPHKPSLWFPFAAYPPQNAESPQSPLLAIT